MRIPLVKGPDFDAAGTDKTEPVVLVNESFIQRYFPHEDPIGKRIRPAARDSRSAPWFRIAGIDSEIPLDKIQAVSSIEARFTAYPRIRAAMLGAFAALALILAMVGVCGVISPTVRQRTQEIGVRMALAAQRRSTIRMILPEGVLFTGGGVVPGYVFAGVLGRYFSALLYNFSAADPHRRCRRRCSHTCRAHRHVRSSAAGPNVDPITALRYE